MKWTGCGNSATGDPGERMTKEAALKVPAFISACRLQVSQLTAEAPPTQP